MQFNKQVQQALRHINSIFPEVTQVFYGADGRWMFCDEEFVAPDFGKAHAPVDVGLLEDAATAADEQKGFPCGYRLLSLDDYYTIWDELADIPVSNGDGEVEADTIEQPFLHFAVGTHREEIWHWFEDQHPDFIVGDVMQGIRRKGANSTWTVALKMESGETFDWAGKADDEKHAEGQAIADATTKTGEQVLEMLQIHCA